MRFRATCSLVTLLLLLALPVMAQERQAVQTVAKQTEKSHSGNVKSRKYHNSGCRYFDCKACTVRFSSAEEAQSKGYTACKVCGG